MHHLLLFYTRIIGLFEFLVHLMRRMVWSSSSSIWDKNGK